MRWLGPLCAGLVLALPTLARGAHCRDGEVESNGFCCVAGARFLGGDCVTGDAAPTGEHTTRMTVVPAFLFDAPGPHQVPRVYVDGKPPVAGNEFEVDASHRFARVDVQGDEIYDTHEYVAVGERRAVSFDARLQLFPNLSVTLEGAIPNGDIRARVTVTCPGEEPQACALEGKERSCSFAVTRCQSVKIRVEGNVNVEARTSIPCPGIARVRIGFEENKPSKLWLAVPSFITAGAIGLMVGSIAASDEGVSHALLGTGAGLFASSFFTFPLMGQWIFAPPIVVRMEGPDGPVTLKGRLAERDRPRVTLGLAGLGVRW